MNHECGEDCLGPDYIARMERALAGPFYEVPQGLTKEQLIAFFDVVARVQFDATSAERERCAKVCERLRDEHCEATQQAPDVEDHCYADRRNGTCDFIAAWDDAAAAIRAGDGLDGQLSRP